MYCEPRVYCMILSFHLHVMQNDLQFQPGLFLLKSKVLRIVVQWEISKHGREQRWLAVSNKMKELECALPLSFSTRAQGDPVYRLYS